VPGAGLAAAARALQPEGSTLIEHGSRKDVVMIARRLGMLAFGASLLIAAGAARADGAYGGWAGDTGGPPPEVAAQTVRTEATTLRDGQTAIYAGWAGDTGGPPPETSAQLDRTEPTTLRYGPDAIYAGWAGDTGGTSAEDGAAAAAPERYVATARGALELTERE
jgi:hypothetical protein